jgi:hypothetical protein
MIFAANVKFFWRKLATAMKATKVHRPAYPIKLRQSIDVLRCSTSIPTGLAARYLSMRLASKRPRRSAARQKWKPSSIAFWTRKDWTFAAKIMCRV